MSTSNARRHVLGLGALLLLTACGMPVGSVAGEQHCYWDDYGNYECYGSVYKPVLGTAGACDYMSWAGSVNGAAVLDADGDVVFFEVAPPHRAVVIGVPTPQLVVDEWGRVRQADEELGTVLLGADPEGQVAAFLVDESGAPLDVELEDNHLRVAPLPRGTDPGLVLSPTFAEAPQCADDAR